MKGAARERQAGRVAAGRGGGAIAELVSSGAGVLAVCADASRRAALASGASGLARFNGGSGRVACSRCGAAALGGLAAKARSGGLALTDYQALGGGGGNAEGSEHVVPRRPVALDGRADARRARGAPGPASSTCFSPTPSASSRSAPRADAPSR